MAGAKPRPFLDTSALFSGVWSAKGGARAILELGELNLIEIQVSAQVLVELEEVLREKMPERFTEALQLLDASNLVIGEGADKKQFRRAKLWVGYEPDALIVADVLAAKPDFFVTLDREHLLGNIVLQDNLPCLIGTPGDFLGWYRALTRGAEMDA
jgi:predicted nucleic acid-binding protein